MCMHTLHRRGACRSTTKQYLLRSKTTELSDDLHKALLLTRGCFSASPVVSRLWTLWLYLNEEEVRRKLTEDCFSNRWTRLQKWLQSQPMQQNSNHLLLSEHNLRSETHNTSVSAGRIKSLKSRRMKSSRWLVFSPLMALLLSSLQTLALQPSAPRPPTHHATAATIPDPPPIVDPFEPTLFDDILLAAFRWTLRQQSQGPRSDLPGFDGMVQELLDFRRLYGLTEQEQVSYQTMVALSGPVPFVYRKLFASREWSPAVLAWFAKQLLPFLVGDMILTERGPEDARTGGVLVKRCRVLEGTNCKGVCAKMCKVPTQRFFAEQWGVPLSMAPNFETGQCQLAFGVTPQSVEDDPTIPFGCLERCPASSAVRQKNNLLDAC